MVKAFMIYKKINQEKNILKYLIFIIMLFIALITNNTFANSNILEENGSYKKLEIVEEYTDKLNIDIKRLNIESYENNNIKIVGEVGINDNFNNNIEAPYNIRKSKNETYNLNDIYIICFSEIKNNIKAYWYREINNNNIGIGYIKSNNNTLINREYGTGNDDTIQNEEIWTNNKLLNTITGSNLLNIEIDKNGNIINFTITIEKDKLSKIRYLYIGANNNIVKNNNTINYNSCLSNYIDLFNYFNETIINDLTSKTSRVDSIKNSNTLKPETIVSTTPLFGAEPPVTANYKTKLLKYSCSGRIGGAHNSMFGDCESTLLNYYIGGNSYIQDNNQIPAIATVNEIKQYWEEGYYIIDYDITYSAPTLLRNLDGVNKPINDGIIYLSSEKNNKIDYSYSLTMPNMSVKDTYDIHTSSSSGFINNKEYSHPQTNISETLYIKINNTEGTQTYSAGTVNNNILSSAFAKDTYCSIVLPYENFLNRTYKGFFPIYNPIFINSRYLWGTYYRLSELQEHIRSNWQHYLFTNGQENLSYPKHPNYSINIENNITKDNTKQYWNNRFRGKFKIKAEDINKYKYINMYAPTAIIKTDTISDCIGYTYQTDGATIYGSPGSTISLNIPSESSHSLSLVAGEGTEEAYSVHSTENYSINIDDYICKNHEYKLILKNENKHYRECKKCKYKEEVDHNYIYEYDGMTNNLCACGYNHNIKHYYHFGSDLINDREEIIIASSSYTTYNNPIKTGYKFKAFDKYVKYFENMTNPIIDIASTSIVNTYVGEVASMSEISDRFSTIYNAKYEPIKYHVNFLPNNNMNLPVNVSNIDPLTCCYDNEYNPPIISYTGYTFKGWTIASGSNTINISKHGKIKNLSAIENTTIDVYPVFEVFNYRFKFATKSNVNKIVITDTIEDLKCYKDTHYNMPQNINVIGYISQGWSLTKGSVNVDISQNEDIYNYTTLDDQEYTLYPVYKPIKYYFKFSNDNADNIDINGNLLNEEFNYDEEKVIDNGLNVRGYDFLGWSLQATSSEIAIQKNQNILNYTTINNEIITLYPVYDYSNYLIEYRTSIGNFYNGLQIATISYTSNTFNDFVYPIIDPNYKYNKKGEITHYDYLEFLGYIDIDTDTSYNSFDTFKNYILDNNNDIIRILYNGRTKTHYNGNGDYSDGGGGSGGGGGNSAEGTITNNNPIIEDKIEIKDITIKTPNKIIKPIKKEVKISKRDLIDLLNEVYSDYKDQNNLQDNIIISINDITYDNIHHDIVDFVNEVYDDYISNTIYEYDLVDYIGSIYNDFVEQNNIIDDIVVGFTNTEIIATNNIVREISNNRKDTKKEELSNINTNKIDENIATKSIIRSNEYLNKIFKYEYEILDAEEIINLLQNRDYIQIYENISNKKYHNTISSFLLKYDKALDNIEKELNKNKYNKLNEKIQNILNSGDYPILREELNNIIINHKDLYNKLKNDLLNYNLKEIIKDSYNDQYKELFNDLTTLFKNKEYNSFYKAIEYELIEGEYADISYDLIYYIFDTIYNYKNVETVEETTVIETTESIVETSEEIIIENEKGNEISFVPVIGFVLILAILITIIIIVVKKITKKKGEEYE